MQIVKGAFRPVVAGGAGNDTAPGGEPLWRVLQGSSEIRPSAGPALNGTKQAAPGERPNISQLYRLQGNE